MLTGSRGKSVDNRNEHDTSRILHTDERNRQGAANSGSDNHLVVHSKLVGELVLKHPPNKVGSVHDGNLKKQKTRMSVYCLNQDREREGG